MRDVTSPILSSAEANMAMARFLHAQGYSLIETSVLENKETALAAKEAELAAALAKVEKLREALHDAICMIGHAMPMDTTVLAGQRLVARDVWQTGYDLLHPKPKKEIA